MNREEPIDYLAFSPTIPDYNPSSYEIAKQLRLNADIVMKEITDHVDKEIKRLKQHYGNVDPLLDPKEENKFNPETIHPKDMKDFARFMNEENITGDEARALEDGWRPWPPENWEDIKAGDFKISDKPDHPAWNGNKFLQAVTIQCGCPLNEMKFWKQNVKET